MLLLLDRHAGTPVYRQIVDQVRFQVVSGVLAAGAELPSTRALAVEQGLNPMTVSKAYAELERLGVLESRPGRSHVVASLVGGEVVREREQELERALEPAVLAARQLAIEPERAAAIFARACALAARAPETEERAQSASPDSDAEADSTRTARNRKDRKR